MTALIALELQKSSKTVASLAYDPLRSDIMTGLLAPGQKLKFNVLSETYGVGMGTLREALHRLTADGLVEAEERRGFTVENVSTEQLADAASVRILLEDEALRRSITCGEVEWEVAVLGSFRRLERGSERARTRRHLLDDQWQAYHRDFRRAPAARRCCLSFVTSCSLAGNVIRDFSSPPSFTTPII